MKGTIFFSKYKGPSYGFSPRDKRFFTITDHVMVGPLPYQRESLCVTHCMGIVRAALFPLGFETTI